MSAVAILRRLGLEINKIWFKDGLEFANGDLRFWSEWTKKLPSPQKNAWSQVIEFVACVRLPDEPKGMFFTCSDITIVGPVVCQLSRDCSLPREICNLTFCDKETLGWKTVQRKSVQCHGRVERPTRPPRDYQRSSEMLQLLQRNSRLFECCRKSPGI